MNIFRIFLISQLLIIQNYNSDVQFEGDAIKFILNKFETHSLVAIGEAHGLIQQHDFFKNLISQTEFGEIGNVIVEFGNALYQEDIDSFVTNVVSDDSKVKECLNNTTQALNLSWQEPIYLEFFHFIRQINSDRPGEQKIRILLGDPPIDWDQVSPDSYREYLSNRDSYFFSVVESEIIRKKEKALIITGVGHLLKDEEGNLGSMLNSKFSEETFIIHPLLNVGGLKQTFKPDLEMRDVPSILELGSDPWSQLSADHGIGIVKVKEETKPEVKSSENGKKIISKPLTGKEESRDHQVDKNEKRKSMIADALIFLGEKLNYQEIPDEKINTRLLEDVNQKSHRVNKRKLAEDLRQLRQMLRSHH